MKKLLILFIILFATNVWGAPPARQNTYVSGTEILASDVTGNEDAIFNYLQAGVDTYADDTIVNADVKSTANIQSDKLNLTSIAQGVNITSGGSFTNAGTMTQSGTVTISGATSISGAVTITGNSTFSGTTIADLGSVTTADLNGGTSDGMNFGVTNEYDAINLDEQGSAPDTAADEGAIYTKLDGSQSELFYREESNGDEVQITDQGSVLSSSNVIYAWLGAFETSTNAPRASVYEGTSFTGATDLSATTYRFIYSSSVGASTLYPVLQGRWKKVAGVNTITPYVTIWVGGSDSGTQAIVKVDIGGANETITGTANQNTPEDKAGSGIDVSGLTDGAVYDINIFLGSTVHNDTYEPCLGSITLIGSQ